MGVVVIEQYTSREVESIWKTALLRAVLAMASAGKPKPTKQLKRLGSVRAIAIKKVSC